MFEGKGVYNSIIVDCAEQNNTWDSKTDFGYFKNKDGRHFLGYKRMMSSFVSNKEAFGQKLKSILNEK